MLSEAEEQRMVDLEKAIQEAKRFIQAGNVVLIITFQKMCGKHLKILNQKAIFLVHS